MTGEKYHIDLEENEHDGMSVIDHIIVMKRPGEKSVCIVIPSPDAGTCQMLFNNFVDAMREIGIVA